MKRNVLLLMLVSLFATQLHAGIVILNGLTHIYRTEKGNVYRGMIEVQNTSTGPQTVKIYLQDLSYKHDGNIYYSPPSTNPKSNAGWIKINSNLLNLKDREKAEIHYEITVPDSINTEGSYWSTIIVEPVDEIIPNKNTSGLQISSIVRYAVQLITNYSADGLKPKLVFEKIDLDGSGAYPRLMVALANEGPIYCRPTVSIELYDTKSGKKIAHISSQAMGLLPNTSKTYPILVEGAPPGRYRAVLYAADQDHNVFSVQAELEI
ncbi:WxL protein host-binding domain-containing protein [Sphingobacterium endophyticum]|uniref:WxL protein host-binding domain-containing protein n=1 Tax=Sphingobacterium endophyticum TaxID=2546448 RepID=UPI0012E193CB|nr:DUF3324 domain-containing protein [Sphingobacterium endophyticum]